MKKPHKIESKELKLNFTKKVLYILEYFLLILYISSVENGMSEEARGTKYAQYRLPFLLYLPNFCTPSKFYSISALEVNSKFKLNIFEKSI